MDENEHKSHIYAIEKMFCVYSYLNDFLINDKRRDYTEWIDYLSWINSQKSILQECLKSLKENYSYANIFPVIRAVYENFWFIDLSMNGLKYYQYFYTKKGQDIKKIYEKWKKDLNNINSNKNLENILEIHLIGKTIRVTYKRVRIEVNGKQVNESIPLYYFLFKDYDPIEAYVGNQKKIIEKYLIPPHLFNKFIKPNQNLRKNYFEFQKGIIPNLLLNGRITEKQKQRVIIHYNFLSLWVHPNKFSFEESKINFNSNKNENKYTDRLILLYIGHLTKMLLNSFIDFLKRQEKEGKISKLNNLKLKEVTEAINDFENTTNYFWFIYNNPSKFYKWDYAINKIWRKVIIQKNITKINLSQIKDNDIPYYNNPLESLKKMSQKQYNHLLGDYTPEIEWK